MDLTDDDLHQLAARGISRTEAERQLAVLRGPAPFVQLERACTVGDGIERWDDAEVARLAAIDTPLSAFIPASGAATRMFKDLAAWDGQSASPAVEKFLAGRDRFAFELPRDLPPHELVRAVVERYANLPKGLLPFHAGGLTPFHEHLVEAEAMGLRGVHFTVSPEHEAGFRALAETARLPVGFSTQAPSTDTLAIDGEGRPFRDERGRLLLRPAGHGALIGNLEASGGDLVVLKNIDNVAAAAWKGPTYLFTRALAGRLAELPASDRPRRVCGMVPNTGEPGGGPFWVQGKRQIVESAQVDLSDPEQKRRFTESTHFNPVFLVCALRDAAGRPYPLADFVDPSAAIVTRKSSGGRELVALERPGLWNGAMAGWDTLFVEVPLAVFNPVKTVNDLLRREHQGD
jgi:hypothetical protein